MLYQIIFKKIKISEWQNILMLASKEIRSIYFFSWTSLAELWNH